MVLWFYGFYGSTGSVVLWFYGSTGSVVLWF